MVQGGKLRNKRASGSLGQGQGAGTGGPGHVPFVSGSVAVSVARGGGPVFLPPSLSKDLRLPKTGTLSLGALSSLSTCDGSGLVPLPGDRAVNRTHTGLPHRAHIPGEGGAQ